HSPLCLIHASFQLRPLPSFFSLLLLLLPPPPRSTLFPYTTLFRSMAAKISITTSKAMRVLRLASSFGSVCRPQPGHFLPLYFVRSEEHTSELQSRFDLVCRLLLEKKKQCDVTTLRVDLSDRARSRK